MIIQYELKQASTGVIISDPQTVTGRDVTLSFSLPTEAAGEYFAVIIGQDGKDSKIRLNNLQCALPNKFIKTQSLRIEVLQVVDERIVKRWLCQPLRLSLLDDLLKATYDAGVDYAALQELYRELVGRAEQQAEQLGEQGQSVTALQAENERKTNQIIELERKLNEAIGAINLLSERVEFMENNYNPLEV